MSTDIGDCQWDDAVWPDMIQMNFTANSGGLTTTYSTYIRDISKMTLTMERIVNVPMNEEVKARLDAELHCGRGWLAYILYDMYGPIQIASLDLLNNPLSDEVAPRVSREEMVKFRWKFNLKSIPAKPMRFITESAVGIPEHRHGLDGRNPA